MEGFKSRQSGKSRRIATLTLNPAVDVACTAPFVRPTHKIRTFDDRLDAGGGGVNVARVLHVLGEDALALIATGGVTGRLVEELLDEEAVTWRALPIRARTRVSLNVHDRETGLEYRFVPEGPVIEPDEVFMLREVLQEVEAEWLVASGSLPRGVPANFYAEIARQSGQRGQKFVLDTSGEALSSAIGHGIDLLKLSLGELEFLIGKEVREPAQQEREARALVRSGAARMIAVSLGPKGALLATGNEVFRCPGLPVTVYSAVGAGDSFLAGLVLGLARGMPQHEALGLAVAAGSASVTSYGTAIVKLHELEALLSKRPL